MGRARAPLLLATILACAPRAAAVDGAEAHAPTDPSSLAAAAFHSSEARAAEIAAAQEGDLTSTGRVLTTGQHPTARLADVEAWAAAPLPRRTHDYHNHHQNSDLWDPVTPRAGDVVVATAYKSGTTWTQAILCAVLHAPRGRECTGILSTMPWVDNRASPFDESAALVGSLEAPRVLKTHLPLDGLPYSPEVKYIHVARDLRDVAWSWHNHWSAAGNFFEGVLNQLPGRFGPPLPRVGDTTPRQAFLDLVAENSPLFSYWHNLATWWAYRRLPNVLHVHYADLKRDPHGEVARLAAFLGAALTGAQVSEVVANTTFDRMKKDSTQMLGKMVDHKFDAGDGVPGGQNFVFKGVNGRWEGAVSPDDIAAYEATARARLGDECARFLMGGRGGAAAAGGSGGAELKSEL